MAGTRHPSGGAERARNPALSLDEELRELRARYELMVESAPEPIFVFDLDEGHFVEVNEAACRLYGLERDALLMAGPVAMSPPRQPDGVAVAESMRAERPTLPIVITSGYSEASPQLSDHGAFLPKPFGLGDVARAIETASTD